MTGAERKKLTRERRRHGVRYMVTIAIYDDALDAFVENGDMSEEEAVQKEGGKGARGYRQLASTPQQLGVNSQTDIVHCWCAGFRL
jgi:hypothetical protein